MIRLGCMIGRMTDVVGAPDFVRGGAGILTDTFRGGSSGDIVLDVDTSFVDPPFSRGTSGFWALDLHIAAQRMTRNPWPAAGAARIGVLFADYYRAHRSAFGIMFDRGFTTPDDPNSSAEFTSLPRECCAIFLGAIGDKRRDDADAQQEALFTTIHEMSHLFNLQHVERPPNFLATSPPRRPYSFDAFRFLTPHERMLANCSRSRNIWPGGSKFGQGGEFNSPADFSQPHASFQFGLDLTISMGQREFYAFEPVELDVELKLANGVQRKVSVRDALDPGYDQFRIWIEEPDGSRRRYRSPRRYCQPTSRISVSANKPFLRDISIFGESGGYTFRSAGIHRLWAEFEPRPGAMLRSNKLDVFVRPSSNDENGQDMRRLLMSPASARLLYHRLIRPEGGRLPNHYRRLAALADRSDQELLSLGAVRYALGRALFEASRAQGSSRLTKRACDWLKRAHDSKTLGRNQRKKALQLSAGL